MTQRDFDAEFEQLLGAGSLGGDKLLDSELEFPESGLEDSPNPVSGDLGPESEAENALSNSTGSNGSNDTDHKSDETVYSESGQKLEADQETGIYYAQPDEDAQIEEVRPMDQGQRTVGLVITELYSAQNLRAVMEKNNIPGRVLGTSFGATIWVEKVSPLDEYAQLLGPQAPLSAEIDAVARQISETMDGAVMAVQSSMTMAEADDETSLAGSVISWRYENGAPVQPFAAGMLVAMVGEDLEDLLLGRFDPLDFPQIDSWRMRFADRERMAQLKRRGRV